jgi:sugar porter (SP) family MFS transporter
VTTPAYPAASSDNLDPRRERLERQLRELEEQILLLTRQMQQQMLLTQGLQQIEQQRELRHLQATQAQQGPEVPITRPPQQREESPSASETAPQDGTGADQAQPSPELMERLRQLQRQQVETQRQLADLRQQLDSQASGRTPASQPRSHVAPSGFILASRSGEATTQPRSAMSREQDAPADAMSTPQAVDSPPDKPSGEVATEGNAQGDKQEQANQQQKQQGSQDNQQQGQRRVRLTGYMTAIGMIAALAGFLFGFDTGVISGAQLFYTKVFHLNTIAQEVSVAAVLIGTIIGAAIGGPLANAIGRRRALIVMAIIFGSGAILTSISWNMWALIVFRIYTGIAVGGGSVIAPMYTTEQSPPKYRGAMVFLFQFNVTLGLLIAYLIDLWFSRVGWGWRPMFGVAIIPAAMLGVGIYALKETPRWLASRGRWDEASAVMQRVTGNDPKEDMQAIRDHLEAERNSSWRELFGPGLRLALITGVGLAVLQQFVGINTIIYYAPITISYVSSSVGQLVGGVIVGLVNAGAALAAIFLVDRVGRRPLLLVGTTGILICLVGLGGFFAVGVKHSGIWPIVTLMVYLICFEFGLGPVYWLLSAELFPDRLRGVGTSLSTVGNWAGNLIVTMTYLTEIKIAGSSFTFWQFAAMALLTIVFIWFMVPETKGRPLEAIGDYWRNGRSWEVAKQKKEEKQGSNRGGQGGTGGSGERGQQAQGQPATA